MNLNNIGYTDFVKEVAIVIANDIEENISYDYTEEEKKELMEDINNEDYYDLQQWIESYTIDVEREVMDILADKLKF